MATSGTYTFQSSQYQVITAALRKVNVLGDFETITDTDNRYVAAFNALNPLIKSYHAYGMPLWKVTESTIPFSQISTTSGVVMGFGTTYVPAPLKVIQALRRDNLMQVDVPMNIYTYEDYELLNNKYAVGPPVHVFHQPLRNTSQLRVWPLPDPTYWQVNGSLFIRYQIPYQDMTSQQDTQELDFPIEWNRALIYALAYELAPEYGLDTEQRALLKRDRDEILELALSFGTEEGSFLIQPRQQPGMR